MIGRLVSLILLFTGLSLSLSGCIVGDGIAHVVKLAQQSGQKKTEAAQAEPAAAPEAAAAPRDDSPPPPPAAAPSRSAVSVESLDPPH
ncbi:hypothetical protein [Telmatospirillum siberiense]|uniref:Uncharacterized protein n=1 Tax=Telmatospirillum siberiense TaxID=382514 RepID=A0A2N3PMM3_9PROT|nr:hypothetical protein [Telmatospirillum siberiense]PKU21659.1 hypothetical protein CWS72_25680 [Telmatospirillum siberiense]